MKFVDDLYELYKDQLVGDEEDAVALVLYTLQNHDREDLLKLMEQLTYEDLYQMLGHFLIEKIKDKMSAEGLGQFKPNIFRDSKNIH